MEVASLGEANGHAISPTLPSVVDPDVVVRHLTDLLEVTLGASIEDLESAGSLLSPSSKHDTLQRCTKFASASQVALYVSKDYLHSERTASSENETERSLGGPFRYEIDVRELNII